MNNGDIVYIAKGIANATTIMITMAYSRISLLNYTAPRFFPTGLLRSSLLSSFFLIILCVSCSIFALANDTTTVV